MAKPTETKVRQVARCRVCRAPAVNGVFRLNRKHPLRKYLRCGAHP